MGDKFHSSDEDHNLVHESIGDGQQIDQNFQ